MTGGERRVPFPTCFFRYVLPTFMLPTPYFHDIVSVSVQVGINNVKTESVQL